MSNDFLFAVDSVPTVNFTEALAQNAASAMNILYGVPPQFARRYTIRAIEVTAVDNFGPELNFFASAAGFTTDPNTDNLISRWGFISSMGEQIGGSGLWRYYVDGLAIPYHDKDTANSVNPPTLHVILQNISANVKNASPAGAIKVRVWMTPQTAF